MEHTEKQISKKDKAIMNIDHNLRELRQKLKHTDIPNTDDKVFLLNRINYLIKCSQEIAYLP